MTDTVFPTGFSTLTVSASLVLFGDDGTNNGNVTIAGLGTYLASNGAISTALAAKAPLASPALTGTPTAPTATGGTNTTQIATTAFVQSAVGGGGGGTITGITTAAGSGLSGGGTSGTLTLTVNFGTTSGTVADGGAVATLLAAKAPLASPTFTGTPAAPTATANDNSTKLATTAYADRAFSSTAPGAVPASGGGTTNFLRADGTFAAPPGGGGSSSVPVTAANSGSSYALAFPASGSAAFDLTLTGNCAFTFSGGTAGQEQMIRVYARGGAGGFTPSFPSGVRWASGTAPTAAISSSATGIYTFRTPDAGTTIFGEF